MDNSCVINYAVIIMFIIIIFLVIKIQKISKNKENFALSPDDLVSVRNEINRIYDMDVEAIRNLGAISKSLLTGTNTFTASATGTPGTLTIPANNTILQGNLTLPASQTIVCPGRLHFGGEEYLYVLNKNGVMIGKEWGGTGNLSVQGNITANEGIYTSGITAPGRLNVTGSELVYLYPKNGLHVAKAGGGNGDIVAEGNISGPTITALQNQINSINSRMNLFVEHVMNITAIRNGWQHSVQI